MNQSCFSLGFLSQNSLQKLTTFHEYKGIYSSVYEKCEKSGHSGNSTSRLEWVTSLSRKLTTQPNWKFCPVVLQLLWPFNSPACFTCVPFWLLVNRKPVARLLWIAHILSFLYTLSHTTLTWIPPKYRVYKFLNYKQIWHGIKPTHDWINSIL